MVPLAVYGNARDALIECTVLLTSALFFMLHCAVGLELKTT